MTFDGKSTKRNNNEYLGIENAKLTFTVKRWVNFLRSGNTKNKYRDDLSSPIQSETLLPNI